MKCESQSHKQSGGGSQKHTNIQANDIEYEKEHNHVNEVIDKIKHTSQAQGDIRWRIFNKSFSQKRQPITGNHQSKNNKENCTYGNTQ